MSELLIREARPSDREDVFEISATVWEGHDYIPEVWEQWVQEPKEKGFLLVGEIDSKVVAIQHASWQPCQVIWMEGIRVHPDYRGRGIAGRMLREALGRAQSEGAVTARLSTADVNQASERVVQSTGFSRVAEFHRFTSTASESDQDNVSTDPINLFQLEEAGALRAGQARLIADGWTVYEMPSQVSPTDYPIHLSRSDPRGLAFGRERPDQDRLAIVMVDGEREGVTAVGLALRADAHHRGLSSVTGMIRPDPEVAKGLIEAGYEPAEMKMHVFELSFRTA